MADNILYTKSAFKHGYTQDDIERAIETKIYMELRDKIAAQMDEEV
jgi:hypothetical protein